MRLQIIFQPQTTAKGADSHSFFDDEAQDAEGFDPSASSMRSLYARYSKLRKKLQPCQKSVGESRPDSFIKSMIKDDEKQSREQKSSAPKTKKIEKPGTYFLICHEHFQLTKKKRRSA